MATLPSDREVRSTCPYCGVGCQVLLHVKDEHIFRVSAPFEAAPNFGMLCVKGRFGPVFPPPPPRLRAPLIRVNRDQPRSATPVWREGGWGGGPGGGADPPAAGAGW